MQLPSVTPSSCDTLRVAADLQAPFPYSWHHIPQPHSARITLVPDQVSSHCRGFTFKCKCQSTAVMLDCCSDAAAKAGMGAS